MLCGVVRGPIKTPKQGGAKASGPQLPRAAVLEADPPAPSQPSDGSWPGPHLSSNLMSDPVPELLSKTAPEFLIV